MIKPVSTLRVTYYDTNEVRLIRNQCLAILKALRDHLIVNFFCGDLENSTGIKGSDLRPRACLAATVPFRSPIQMTLSLPFQNGEKVIFTAETVAQRNGTVAAKQVLREEIKEPGTEVAETRRKAGLWIGWIVGTCVDSVCYTDIFSSISLYFHLRSSSSSFYTTTKGPRGAGRAPGGKIEGEIGGGGA